MLLIYIHDAACMKSELYVGGSHLLSITLLDAYLSRRYCRPRNEKTALAGGFFEGSVSWGTSGPR